MWNKIFKFKDNFICDYENIIDISGEEMVGFFGFKGYIVIGWKLWVEIIFVS